MIRARRLFAAHEQADRTGAPVDGVLGLTGEARGHTRRELLIGAGGLAAGATLARSPPAALAFRITKLQAHPRIAIVGAGLAGLRCAHMLWTQSPGDPVLSTVYEANPDRAGGRCWTLRDHFAGGLITEHGGSFINSDQTAIRHLASRLGLSEVVVNGGDLPHGEEVFFIDGRLYTYAAANADWHEVGFPAFRKAANEMNTAAGTARLDRMSVPEWLDGTDIGSGSRFGKLMMADTVTENGGFSTLRHVELKRSGLSATKRRVVATMGMGTNAKIHLEVSHKTWPALGYSGATYGDWRRLACAWDDTVQLGPDASPALYLAFPGGKTGRTGLTGKAHGTAPARDVRWALSQIDHVFPGTTGAYTGRAYEDHWARDPWVYGAYSYYRVGQAASYGELAGATEGRFLFAGEHTSIDNIGFLDGAVETGERAARRLFHRIGA